MSGWDDAPVVKPSATPAASEWDHAPVAAQSAPKPEDWQATQFGFKVKTGEAPTGGPATIREDGAINQPGEQGWKFFDPKTGVYAPAPSEPWANKGILSTALGADTLSHYGRNLKAGWDSAMGGLYDLGSRAATATGVQAPESRMEAIRRINAGLRNSQALKNTGGSTATTAQFAGEAAPVVAASAVLSPQVAAFLPSSAAGIAAPTALGLSTAAMTPGTMQERAQAGELAATVAPLAEAGVNKLLIPGAKAVLAGGKRIASAITTKGEDFAPEAVVNWFKNRVPGKASDVLQEDLQQQYAAARARGGAPFQELRTQDGTVPMQPYIDKIEEAIGQIQRSGFSDKEPIIQQLERLKSTAQEGPMTWGKAMDIGTDINDKISQAMSGANPDRNLARILQPIKSAHQEALDQAGSQFGDLYKQAKQAWIDNVVPWEDPKQGGRLLKSFMNSPTPDQAMNALLKAKSEDKVNIFINQLSKDKGIPALQAGLADAVYQQSLDESGKVIPAKFLGALKARQDAYGLSFTGEAKWRMDGLATLLRDSKFTAQFLTGEWLRHVPGGRILPGSAVPTPDAGSILQKIFTSPTGSKFLIQAQGLKPNSPALGALVDRYAPKLLGESSGIALAPNVQPLRPTLPAAADTGTANERASQ